MSEEVDSGRSRYKRHIKGVRIVDMTLAELGRNLVAARNDLNEAKYRVKILEDDQTARINKLMKVKHLDWEQVSDDEAIITNPRPFPTETQRPVFALFEQAMELWDESLLTQVYELGCEMRCQFTSWETEHGECFDVAYSRRIGEIRSAESGERNALVS